MKKLFNRTIVRKTETSETKAISREEVVSLFGEEKVAEYEKMQMLGMSPQLVATQSWVNRLISKFWLSDADIFQLGMEVYLEHAEIILDKLGMTEDNDGILDRIVMYTKVPEKGDCRGAFHHTCSYRGLFGTEGAKYVEGSGRIEVNSLSPVYCLTKKGYQEMKPVRLAIFRNKVKQQILFTLAHEMRHYWQYYTGEVFNHRMGKIQLMPYEWRWEEKDANQFAYQYVYGKK